MNSASPPLSPDDYTRRAVRAWWADGLWDFALAGFFTLAALWSYPLSRIIGFPSWTWPWPFITQEPINPLQREINFWILSSLPLGLLYAWGAYKLVDWLKARLIAPRLGYVRHSFWLRLNHKIYLLFGGLYLVTTLVLGSVYVWAKGGPHFLSVFLTTAPAGILFILGQNYQLPRYRWLALGGGLVNIGLELFFTTPANYLQGPTNFFDVSPMFGNPALPCLIWALGGALSGAFALQQILRDNPMPDKPDPNYTHLTEVDRLVHEPARLAILGVLAGCESADFEFMLRATNLTKGNLSAHAIKLEQAGYVQVEKSFHGKISYTLYRLTKAGRKALELYREQLKRTLAKLG